MDIALNATDADIIDDEWINQYKHEEEKYDIFYKKEVSSIKLFFIYISSSQDKIDKIIKEKYNIINKSISKKELTEIIKQHDASSDKNKEYILNSLFKYNITLKPDEIEDFINNENEYENDYMTNIILHEDEDAAEDEDEDEEFEDILFENTIDFFKDLNAIYIIYALPSEIEAAEEVPKAALVRKKLKKTKKNTHNSIKNNKTSKNQKNLKII
jgi:hypothetical protein